MNTNITVLCGEDPQITAAFAETGSLSIRFAASADEIGTDCGCAAVSETCAGEQLPEILAKLRALRVPAVVLTVDGSEDNRYRLRECGAEEIIALPVSKEVLVKRLTKLAAAPAPTDTVDFDAFAHTANTARGAFIVDEHDFGNVYTFVTRMLERLDKNAQLIVFSFKSPCGPIAENEDVSNFIRIGQACLRRGDIATVRGTQVLLMLLGTDRPDAMQVIRRLTDTFEAHFCDATSRISFEIREIEG